MLTYLVVGCCGSGKTWVMRQLIEHFGLDEEERVGLYTYRHNGDLCLLGKYDGSMYEGSDRLSMGIMRDNAAFLKSARWRAVVAEGDRFTNASFIRDFKPFVIKIADSGIEGLRRRRSTQSERHLKAIRTRVGRIKADHVVRDSAECLAFLKQVLFFPNSLIA